MKKFISETINTQNKLLGTINENNEVPKETSDFLTKIFGSLESAYPPIETSIEGAKKAIVILNKVAQGINNYKLEM